MVEDKTRAAKERLAIIQSDFQEKKKVNLDTPDPIEICRRT
jgi:hypothetical protein